MTIPRYRVDVTREADVIEEVLRVYGYNNIEVSASLNTVFPSFDSKTPNKVEQIAAQLMALVLQKSCLIRYLNQDI